MGTYLVMFKHDHKYRTFMVALPAVRIGAIFRMQGKRAWWPHANRAAQR